MNNKTNSNNKNKQSNIEKQKKTLNSKKIKKSGQKNSDNQHHPTDSRSEKLLSNKATGVEMRNKNSNSSQSRNSQNETTTTVQRKSNTLSTSIKSATNEIPEIRKMERSNSFFLTRKLSKLIGSLTGSRESLSSKADSEDKNLPPFQFTRSRSLIVIRNPKRRSVIEPTLEELSEEMEKPNSPDLTRDKQTMSTSTMTEEKEVDFKVPASVELRRESPEKRQSPDKRQSMGETSRRKSSLVSSIKRTFNSSNEKKLNTKWSSSLLSLQEIDNMVSYENLSFIDYDKFNEYEKTLQRRLSHTQSRNEFGSSNPSLSLPVPFNTVVRREKRGRLSCVEAPKSLFIQSPVDEKHTNEDWHRFSLDDQKLNEMSGFFANDWNKYGRKISTESLSDGKILDTRNMNMTSQISLNNSGLDSDSKTYLQIDTVDGYQHLTFFLTFATDNIKIPKGFNGYFWTSEGIAENILEFTEQKILLQPFVYIQQIPGKQIRSKLALAFNHWLDIPQEKLILIGEIVQMLHNSSLLIDDIEDNSILRRGIPVAHSIYGVATTINVANYVLFLALQKVQELEHPEATKVYTEQLLELHRGQGMEIYWRDNFQCPTESEYKLMTIRKTGGLFMLAIRLMQLFSKNKDDFTKLTAILGLYFQIRDDYCNLSLKEYSENKSFCEDLTEGKFSFPIIHAVQNQKNDKQVLHILRQRTVDIEVKKYCINLLEKLGSFKYTRDILEKLDQQAREEVARHGQNPIMEELLNDLLSWKISENNGGDEGHQNCKY